jgi:hypothetical protein
MKIPKNKQYAFWSHDRFPYCLGGTVIEITKTRAVETEEYGRGYHFKPFLFTTLEKGKALKERLDTLSEQRETTLSAVKSGFDLALDKVIKLPKE